MRRSLWCGRFHRAGCSELERRCTGCERSGHELPEMRSGNAARLSVFIEGWGLQLCGRSARLTAKRKACSGVCSDNASQAQPPCENRGLLLRELQAGPVPVLTPVRALPHDDAGVGLVELLEHLRRTVDVKVCGRVLVGAEYALLFELGRAQVPGHLRAILEDFPVIQEKRDTSGVGRTKQPAFDDLCVIGLQRSDYVGAKQNTHRNRNHQGEWFG